MSAPTTALSDAMVFKPTENRLTYYRERAADARAKADAMRDYEARQTMLQAASMWDLMAKTAEEHSPPERPENSN
jgi:hypothetical protein